MFYQYKSIRAKLNYKAHNPSMQWQKVTSKQMEKMDPSLQKSSHLPNFKTNSMVILLRTPADRIPVLELRTRRKFASVLKLANWQESDLYWYAEQPALCTAKCFIEGSPGQEVYSGRTTGRWKGHPFHPKMHRQTFKRQGRERVLCLQSHHLISKLEGIWTKRRE